MRSIEAVTFSTPSAETRARWSAEESFWGVWWAKAPAYWSLAETIGVGVDGAHARLVALPSVERALNVAKVAAFAGNPNVVEQSRYLWRLTGHWKATSVTEPEERSSEGFTRAADAPFVIPVGKTIKIGLDESHSALDLLRTAALSDKLRKELGGVVRWIARALAETDEDEQIVQLATALESLLLSGYREDDKGELLALRYSLLGGLMNPAALVLLYDRRSDVVHEGDTEGFAPVDLWRLRLEVLASLQLALRVVSRRPDVTDLRKLVAHFESRQRLEKFVESCNRGVWGLLVASKSVMRPFGAARGAASNGSVLAHIARSSQSPIAIVRAEPWACPDTRDPPFQERDIEARLSLLRL